MQQPVVLVNYNMRARRKVMIVSGEASGDMHGAKLAESLCAYDAHIELFGIGGEKMRSAGVHIEFDARRLAVVGITEVFAKLEQSRQPSLFQGNISPRIIYEILI